MGAVGEAERADEIVKVGIAMIEFVDKTGQMRDPEDFSDAIVAWTKFMQSPEFITAPYVAVFGLTILDALKIARTISVLKTATKER